MRFFINSLSPSTFLNLTLFFHYTNTFSKYLTYHSIHLIPKPLDRNNPDRRFGNWEK